MRKLMIISLVLFMPFILAEPLQAGNSHQQADASPADLFPEGTLAYLEFPSTLPFFADLDFAPWVGERIGVGIYLPVDPGSPRLRDLIPTMALVFQVRDEDAADAFVSTLVGANWRHTEVEGGYLWTEQRPAFARAILRLDGYLVMGSARGTEMMAHGQEGGLRSTPDFVRVKNALSGSPTLWGYGVVGGFAIYTGEVFSIEVVTCGNPPDLGIPDALDEAALTSIPQDAFAVISGTDISLILQRMTGVPEALFDFLRDLDPAFAEIADLPDSLFRTMLGVDYEREFLPLFDGGYAGFLTFGFGSGYAALGIPIDGGFVLAPEDSANAIFTSSTITNRLEQSGLPITRISPTTFSLDTGTGLDLYFGFMGGRLYLSTESGMEDIQQAVDGRNLTDNDIWKSTLVYAPEGTQQVIYLNLRSTAAFIDTGRAAVPEAVQNLIGDILTYVRQYDSLALFHRVDEDGTRITKFVLLSK